MLYNIIINNVSIIIHQFNIANRCEKKTINICTYYRNWQHHSHEKEVIPLSNFVE